jgi:hypothetical protein
MARWRARITPTFSASRERATRPSTAGDPAQKGDRLAVRQGVVGDSGAGRSGTGVDLIDSANWYCAALFHDSDARPTVLSQISQLRHPYFPVTAEVLHVDDQEGGYPSPQRQVARQHRCRHLLTPLFAVIGVSVLDTDE